MRVRAAYLLALAASCALLAGCGGEDEAATPPASTPSTSGQAADLSGVKEYLLEHTALLTGFTGRFKTLSGRYYELAEARDFDAAELWSKDRAEVGPLVNELKDLWVEGNPYYERMEGVVAGTPSLAEYDVIIDAGSSAAEDPAGAVPFDLELSDGRSLEKPGNLYNLTEGALWGTLPEDLAAKVPSTPVDLDGDGTQEFGEVLPDAKLIAAASAEFDRYAQELANASSEWKPTPSDALTALVVMVPTMNEYFGQWKESRFVRGAAADSESFNVVSRLSDIHDILASLEVIFDGVQPLYARAGQARAEQTEAELGELSEFMSDLHDKEQGGKRFTPEEADQLGTEAQSRATAIAGQVSQAAAELGIEIEQ